MSAYSEQLEAMLRNPHSEPHRKWFFGILADIESPADVEPWLSAASDLYARGVIDEDGWVYFAAMFMESLTFGDSVTDPELVRIQREIDALDAVESWKRGDDEDDEPWKQRDDDVDADGFSPAMRALFAAYDARVVSITVSYLRGFGYHELADLVELDHDAFVKRSAIGASNLFDEDCLID